ncbi:helix-turn-helix domain-containing protein [Escherichia coli]|nr:helix-turn-helix domain-containing protein [Escherichia coli]
MDLYLVGGGGNKFSFLIPKVNSNWLIFDIQTIMNNLSGKWKLCNFRGEVMKNKIVSDIVEWIENSLRDNIPVDINMVTNKSGYSFRRIHDLFKSEIGDTIGSYIRKRRITQAAFLVRFTNKPIFDIAMDLNFTSQQAFTRTFSRYFRCTPLQYRNKYEFNTSELYAPFLLKNTETIFKYESVNISLKTTQIKYDETILGNGNSEAQNTRLKEIKKILLHNEYAYIASQLHLENKVNSTVKVFAFIGVNNETDFNFEIKNRMYYVANFSGSWDEYKDFSRSLFLKSRLIRGRGYDIEQFSLAELNENTEQIFDVKIFYPL